MVALALLLVPAAGAALLDTPWTGSSEMEPLPGAWLVSTHETYEDEILDVKGNILIQDGGTLELVRSTLVMNATPPAEPIIQVEAGGKLVLNGTRDRRTLITDGPLDQEARDEITGADGDFHYRIRVDQGGSLHGRHCNITDVGFNQLAYNYVPPPVGEAGLAGLSVLGGTMILKHCIMYDSENGFYANESLIQLENYAHIPGSKHTSPSGSGNFAIDGGSVVILNSSFTYWGNLQGVEDFRIDNSTWVSHLADRSTGGIGFIDSTGLIENSRIQGLSTALSVGRNSSIVVRDSTIESVQRAVQLGLGPDDQYREVRLENVRIMDVTPPPGFGAISVRGGYSHAKVIAMNTTITDIRGPSLLVWGGQEAVLRNVTFDQRRIEIEDGVKGGVSINTEGLLRVTASHAGDGSPLAAVHVELERNAAGDRQTATTGLNGETMLWVPAETYDASDGGRWVPVDPDGWTVTMTHEGTELVHTVPWTPQAAHINVVWDEGRGLRLADAADGGAAPVPWIAAFLAMAVAASLAHRRRRP